MLGAVPIVRDAFHVFWKANRRNYRLLIREKQEPGRNIKFDWIYLLVIRFSAAAIFAVPILALIWIGRRTGWM
jgi:hypothetical protein